MARKIKPTKSIKDIKSFNNLNRHAIQRLLCVSIVVLVAVISVININYRNKKIAYLNQVLHDNKNILGSSTDSDVLTVNFNNQIAIGSPLVFGGVHVPNNENQDAWNLLRDVGFTSIRRDFWIETEVPSNITLDEYKSNKNNIQDPKNWNWNQSTNNINKVNENYINAKKRGMKVIAIISYAPAWLTYTGTTHGVPKDWNVYKDIVKKLYRIHRPYIDMAEIWNEPDWNYFLDTNGSGLTPEEAYLLIFKNASEAIREVDLESADGKFTMIGGPSLSKDVNLDILESLLQNTYLKKYISFISYHNYDNQQQFDISKIKNLLNKYGMEKIPIFLTEWNKSSSEVNINPFQTTNLAIAYTGQELLKFLNSGLTGANYFSTTLNVPTNVVSYQSVFGIYRLDTNKQSYLLPQGKTWQILSKSLGLGTGNSKIYQTRGLNGLESTGFINSKNEKGLAVVNNSFTPRFLEISLTDLGANRGNTVQVYAASAVQDGKTPCSLDLLTNLSGKSLFIESPEQSIVGVLIQKRQQTLRMFFSDILGITSTQTCALLK